MLRSFLRGALLAAFAYWAYYVTVGAIIAWKLAPLVIRGYE